MKKKLTYFACVTFALAWFIHLSMVTNVLADPSDPGPDAIKTDEPSDLDFDGSD